MKPLPVRFFLGVLALLAALAAPLALPGCDECPDVPPLPNGGTVVVSIPPLAGLVQPLLPPNSTVRVLVPAGRSAHGYQPSPEDVAAIGRADAIVFVGLNLESGMARAVRGKTVITMADLLGIEADPHAGHDHSGHDHGGHDHAHDHGADDPHMWLDPVLAAAFVRALPGALPASLRTDETDTSAAWLADAIDRVDADYRERLAPFQGRAIVTHHASFNRPAERYGLEVAAVLRAIETLEPSPAEMAAAVRAIKDRGVRTIFVEPQFGMTSAQRVAEASGVELVTLDPLGDGNWIDLMRGNLDALVRGLSAGEESSPGVPLGTEPATVP
jgi:zinc transport system substrate-binding protein